jgi:hypothetical protein
MDLENVKHGGKVDSEVRNASAGLGVDGDFYLAASMVVSGPRWQARSVSQECFAVARSASVGDVYGI